MKWVIWCTLLLSSFIVAAYDESEFDNANTLAKRGIINLQNTPEDYRLDDTITRREFMKVVVKLVWEHVEDVCHRSFTDVISSDWACKYIEWALMKNFIAANTTFRPNDNITKAESMKLILKARNIARIENSWDWRQDDMRTAYRKRIVENEYTDYNTYATRGWIFSIAATPTSSMWWWSWFTGWEDIDIEHDDWRNMVP